MLGSPGSGSITVFLVLLLLLLGFISSTVKWNKAGCPAGPQCGVCLEHSVLGNLKQQGQFGDFLRGQRAEWLGAWVQEPDKAELYSLLCLLLLCDPGQETKLL